MQENISLLWMFVLGLRSALQQITQLKVCCERACFNCEDFQVPVLGCSLSSNFSFVILCCVWSTWLDEDDLNLVPNQIFAPVSLGDLILSVEWKPLCFLSLLLECLGFSGELLSDPCVHALPHTMNHSHTSSLPHSPVSLRVQQSDKWCFTASMGSFRLPLLHVNVLFSPQAFQVAWILMRKKMRRMKTAPVRHS